MHRCTHDGDAIKSAKKHFQSARRLNSQCKWNAVWVRARGSAKQRTNLLKTIAVCSNGHYPLRINQCNKWKMLQQMTIWSVCNKSACISIGSISHFAMAFGFDILSLRQMHDWCLSATNNIRANWTTNYACCSSENGSHKQMIIIPQSRTFAFAFA